MIEVIKEKIIFCLNYSNGIHATHLDLLLLGRFGTKMSPAQFTQAMAELVNENKIYLVRVKHDLQVQLMLFLKATSMEFVSFDERMVKTSHQNT